MVALWSTAGLNLFFGDAARLLWALMEPNTKQGIIFPRWLMEKTEIVKALWPQRINHTLMEARQNFSYTGAQKEGALLSIEILCLQHRLLFFLEPSTVLSPKFI